MKHKLTIVKVGGKIVEEPASLNQLLTGFTQMEGRRILVHGGGRTATRMASSLGIETHMIDGRRVTDSDMLRVVTMVYGGLVNKNIVAQLNAKLDRDADSNLMPLGLTGADMSLIRSHKRPPLPDGTDYGFVGDVDSVNTDALHMLLEGGTLPIIAPLTLGADGQLLNTNADTIAGSVATAMASIYDVTLVFCFEHKGVLSNADNPDSVIPRIDSNIYSQLKAEGIVSGGMLPKLDNSFAALRAGVKQVIITRADLLADLSMATVITL